MVYLWTVRRRNARGKSDVVGIVRDRDYGGLRASQPDMEQLASYLSERDRVCLERGSHLPWFTSGQDTHCYLNPRSARGHSLNPYYFYRFEH